MGRDPPASSLTSFPSIIAASVRKRPGNVTMSRFTLFGAATLGLLILVGACFWPAISGRQFAYRDAAHYYYPLYQKVQSEWDAGRVPLWETEENAGMPLLGNPTAAVLYPGKLIYTLLPYPLAARVYVIAHTLLAFAGMLLLGRSLGIGMTGSVVSAFAYAFGAPILFQYCNIIYLVGAAWVPWGLMAVDRWLRLGRRWAIPGLAVVLAMQVLGGEPQAAYLEGLCAGVYAILLTRHERRSTPLRLKGVLGIGLLVIVGLAVWTGVTLEAAHQLMEIRPKKIPAPTFVWNRYLPTFIAGLWGLAGLVFLVRWIKGRGDASIVGRRLAGLAVAAVLAGGLTGAQLLPVLEFASLTGRNSDEGAHDVYPFSLEPYRVAELVWPNVYGTIDRGNHSWVNIIPPATSHRVWVPSLYLGGATLLLALAGVGFRGGPPWRGWLTGIAVVTLLASFGEFAGPLWVGRFFEPVARYVGPHDPPETNAIRVDGALRDGDGSFYWFLSTVIPGFQQFRYPSKLLTFTSVALALLAGYGWDRVGLGERRRLLAWAGLLLCVSAIVAVMVALNSTAIAARFARAESGSAFGPLEPAGAVNDILRGLIQGAIVIGLTVAAVLLAKRRPRLAGVVLMLTVSGDLALANRGIVMTADQSVFERKPRTLELIEEAEKLDPAPGPFRIHRMPVWNPLSWRTTASTDRVREFVDWERNTIQPKYGLTYGVKYTHTQGVAELFDYEWFFSPWTVSVLPAIASHLQLKDPDERIVYYPRRGFDLWNTRYFILPAFTPWTNAERGVISLMHETEKVFPKRETFKGEDAGKQSVEWARTVDYQIVRNLSAFPRAWIVHDVRLSAPVEGMTRDARKGPMEEMLYAGDPFWQDQSRHVYDLRSLAYVEVADDAPLRSFRTRGSTGPDEGVTVREPHPQRVELDVVLNRPGFVILGEVFYPGWTLTIDGQPATILRANRLMRGAAVESGKHTLVYEYHPRSFAVGKVFSAAGFAGLVMTGLWATWSSCRRQNEGVLAS